MRILLLGGGGREHAIGWKLAKSPLVSELMSLPGNPGLAKLGPVVSDVQVDDVGAIALLAEQQRIDLVVVGPETPLALGVVDVLDRRQIPVFGPDRYAARLESSKAFAKDVMQRSGIRTAAHVVYDKAEPAFDHIARSHGPYVVKADGLAGGKGVLVTADAGAARAWVIQCLDPQAFGDNARVVIEDYLEGPEISVFAICDGSTAIPLAPARDYKRLLDGDAGPNTGGMGSYSPVADLPENLVEYTMSQVVAPVMKAMAEDGHPYVGFLYVGYVLTDDGPSVLEFNCRLGDPEAQVVLPRLESDLADVLVAAAGGDLGRRTLTWSDEAAVNVVLAARGYPTDPRRDDRIRGLANVEDATVFHAATSDATAKLLTAGGRVLHIVGRGANIAKARAAAYAAVERIRFAGMQYRTDIALENEMTTPG